MEPRRFFYSKGVSLFLGIVLAIEAGIRYSSKFGQTEQYDPKSEVIAIAIVSIGFFIRSAALEICYSIELTKKP
ncbi:MAG: hypothetical protein A3D35_02875 [Candidatus Staskawiczbacteria bacterium RIFCSPHIGHO2_02_FULL_34_9]|uniref:Uncharacterized protein n=1 Tax=Candidatus Staskawiczbacteria bacterium RIFCSPHIGHO2_02_FULL_34_9 TaxID=1802206 RepID=A0A1G2HY70_9BACT|nr:MAG: hypothetical protein A3D35_02875 [Candidatus Staskawiczbacteria bacterium RIFCSPHIGHO2_02_FULL_34_9]